jgi:hypothetical protein
MLFFLARTNADIFVANRRRKPRRRQPRRKLSVRLKINSTEKQLRRRLGPSRLRHRQPRLTLLRPLLLLSLRPKQRNRPRLRLKPRPPLVPKPILRRALPLRRKRAKATRTLLRQTRRPRRRNGLRSRASPPQELLLPLPPSHRRPRPQRLRGRLKTPHIPSNRRDSINRRASAID